VVSGRGSGGNRRVDGQREGRDRWRKRIEVQQRSRNRGGKTGSDRALGTVPVLVVIDVTGAVMMAAVMSVLTPGIEKLNELGL